MYSDLYLSHSGPLCYVLASRSSFYSFFSRSESSNDISCGDASKSTFLYWFVRLQKPSRSSIYCISRLPLLISAGTDTRVSDIYASLFETVISNPDVLNSPIFFFDSSFIALSDNGVSIPANLNSRMPYGSGYFSSTLITSRDSFCISFCLNSSKGECSTQRLSFVSETTRIRRLISFSFATSSSKDLLVISF